MPNQMKHPIVLKTIPNTSRRVGNAGLRISQYKYRIMQMNINKLRISFIYALNLGVSFAFTLLVTPSFPLLRDSLTTTAVVTIVITALTSKVMIWFLSIEGRSTHI